MGKLKIAYIGQRGVPPTFGGVERYVDEIVKRLPRDEVETYTYCRRHYVENTSIDYTRQVFVPSLEAKGLEAFSHSLFSALDVLKSPVDIAHFQALGPALFSFLPKIRGAKIIVTVHGLDWQRAKWGATGKLALKSGDWMMGHTSTAIISVSKNLKRYYEDKYRKEVFFVPIGFSPPKQLKLDLMNRKFGLEPQKYVLFLNRLVPEKGIHYLIEAFKSIKRDDFKLVIAGESFQGDKYCASLRDLAKSDRRIIFTGYVTREEAHELYTNAYLFSLPSELEGMPAVILESLSHKCPVLISDIDECLDLIQHDGDIYGFVHRNKDVADLEYQLKFLLDHPEKVDGMRQPGFDYVSKYYSWDKAVDMTYDVYKHVLNGG
jgi:glycosyltransferase involved in cell wall biosynthesis